MPPYYHGCPLIGLQLFGSLTVGCPNLRLRSLLQIRHPVAVSHYIANVRDLEFNLFEVLELGTVPLRPSSTTPPTTHVH